MGSDPIALPLLDWMAGEGSPYARVAAVYTQLDRPAGRGKKVEPGPISRWAVDHALPVRQPERLGQDECAWLAAQQADLVLVMAYGQILRDEFIAIPRLGTLNLHASILPGFRGASPIQTAVACGERETGVALMRIVKRLDAGPVADVERVPVAPLDTAREGEARLAQACVPLLRRALPRLSEGSLAFVAQEETRASYCRRLFKEDGQLDFSAPLPGLRRFLFSAIAQNHQAGAPGETVAVTAEVDGRPREVSLLRSSFAGRWSEPFGQMPALPLAVESRRLEDGVRYLHFSVFSLEAMAGIRTAIRAAAGAPGLVLDLRGNPGGVVIVVNGIAGLLTDRDLPLGTTRLRNGHFNAIGYPQAGAFLGPLAVLVDSCSASCSEILAAGLQEAGRARVFGTPTAGAVLPSQFRRLPNGDLLQHVIADYHTPKGVALEGFGCQPDEVVALTRADLAAGRDPVLQAAEAWLKHPTR